MRKIWNLWRRLSAMALAPVKALLWSLGGSRLLGHGLTPYVAALIVLGGMLAVIWGMIG